MIYFIKFIHITFALSLVVSVVYCFFSARENILSINKIILGQVLFALISGTLLIYPSHFTFHTPWIQAAFLMVFVFSFFIFLLNLLAQKIKYRLIWQMTYLLLFVLLVIVIHDAVTKTTLF